MSNNAHTNRRETGREGGQMASFETEVREFAREFPTPNVKLMVRLCEEGRISWAQAHEVSRKALAEALSTVA